MLPGRGLATHICTCHHPIGPRVTHCHTTRTNRVMTRVNFCHVACHVGLDSTSTNQRLTRVICATWQSGPCARRTFPGCCGNPPVHPPAHHPPPTRVFLGSSPGVRKFHGCFGKFPGRSGKFRVFLGTSGCFRKVPGVFGKFRVFLESSGCFWDRSSG